MKIASLYEDCMEPGRIGKFNTNNLLGPTDVTENPYGDIASFLEFVAQGTNINIQVFLFLGIFTDLKLLNYTYYY